MGPSTAPEYDPTKPLGDPQNPDPNDTTYPWVSFPENGRWVCVQWKVVPGTPPTLTLVMEQGKKAEVNKRRCKNIP